MRYEKADEIVVDGNSLRATIGCGGAALLLAVGLGVAGWQFHWWAAAQSAQKNAQINRQSLPYQAAAEDEINQSLPQLDNLNSVIAETVDQAQRAALTKQAQDVKQKICIDYNKLNQSYIEAMGVNEQQELAQLCVPAPVATQQ